MNGAPETPGAGGADGPGPDPLGTAEWLARGLGQAPGAGGWTPPAAESLAGVFPGLRVLALAGRGGMGAVYRAEQTRLGRTVAVKIMAPGATPDPLARERFEREARVLSGLNHPHVLQVYDFGALADGTHYLVTEWAEGGDLGKLLAGRPHPLAEVQVWVEQIASALGAAHARGVVHRDLKPANVLVRADGRLALADFGLAHAQGMGFTTTLTLSGMVFGTFDYMAPEQMESAGKVTPATDLFALGVMTYQMVTGRLPKGAYARPSRMVGVPEAVDAALDEAMAGERERRPKDAAEFARKFAAACGAKRTKRRGPRLVLAFLLAAVAAGAWWQVGKKLRMRSVREEPAAVAANEARPAAPVPTIPVAAPEPVAFPPATIPAASLPAEKEPASDVVSTEGQSVENASPAAPARPAAPTSQAPWSWLLPEVNTARQARAGEWSRRGSELKSGAEVCTLRLPVSVPADFCYDVAVEFTRMAGRNSVGIFLPTSSGTGVFELDAWEQGLGGIQMIDGQDMRAHGEHFPAALNNGEKQQLILQVRGARVSATWNGRPRMSWNLEGRRYTNNWLWDTGADMGLGLCSWKSPTLFHRVAYRPVPGGAGQAPAGR